MPLCVRTLNRNRNLIMNEVSLAPINDEQWALYQRYQNGRHEGGSMSKMTREQVNSVLFATCTDSRFLEFRTSSDSENPNELKMVCIIDRLDDALSAVYTFYDPDAPKLSLGTFGILSEIEYAQQNGLRYVYLGYWLPDYPNMDYKETLSAHGNIVVRSMDSRAHLRRRSQPSRTPTLVTHHALFALPPSSVFAAA